MSSIRTVVIDHDAAGHLGFAEVEQPIAAPSEAIVRVAAISLNRGEVRRAARGNAGDRIGWDFAGIVEQAASDGSGPKAGRRVVGMLESGAWAEQIAVEAEAIAELPDAISFEQAATLPIAGLTALYTLETAGPILGRKVLVTGASGGVGVLACQIARYGGAYVVGVVRSTAHESVAREAGAHEVVVGEENSGAAPFGPFDTVLESVGGASLASSIPLLASDGTCVLFGQSGGAESTIDFSRFYSLGGATLYGFIIFHEVKRRPASAGLARLCQLVVAGVLQPRIGVRAPWTQIGEIAQRLTDRTFPGKAVLTVGE